MRPISSQVFWRPDFENHWLREIRQTVAEMGSRRYSWNQKQQIRYRQVGGAGWGVVGQVSTRGTLEAQKEWKEFVLILSEWEGFLQGVEQGEVM